ncbi:hypothetical protein N9Z29_00365 [bacterium]|nr:hypothetical protein [bacterium]
MRVGYTRINADGLTEQVLHSEHDTREEAHTAAVALADSLVDTADVVDVQRGYANGETTFQPRVIYNVPPTDEQRNPS